jgi:hypothetical protein
MESDYRMIFSGSKSDVILIKSQLVRHDIVPIIKDEEESVRLSGFAHPVSEQIKVFVHKDELETALKVLETLNI